MEFITQSVVIGVAYDAPLVLAAIGFALLYRLTGLINVAYAETLTLGAYFAMWLNTTFGLDFYAVLIPTAILGRAASAWPRTCVIFRPAKRRNVGGLEMIIISFGLSIFLRYGLQFIFGSPVRFFDVPPPDTVPILGVGVTSFRLVAVISVALLSLLLYLFIQRSNFGLQIRALASDEQLAQVSGIRPARRHRHDLVHRRRGGRPGGGLHRRRLIGSTRCSAGTSSSSSCSSCSSAASGVSVASSSRGSSRASR